MSQEKTTDEQIRELIRSQSSFMSRLPDIVVHHGNQQFKKGQEHQRPSPETIRMIGGINEKIAKIQSDNENMNKNNQGIAETQSRILEKFESFEDKVLNKIQDIRDNFVHKGQLDTILENYTKVAYVKDNYLSKIENSNSPMVRIFWKIVDIVIASIVMAILVVIGLKAK